MAGDMNDQGVAVPVQSRSVADVFNLIAAGYDREALRFFPYAADRLIARLKPAHGIKILDTPTGTGVAALAAVRRRPCSWAAAPAPASRRAPLR